MVDLDEVDLMA